MIIAYISTNPKLNHAITQKYEGQGYQFQDFKNLSSLEIPTLFLLFSPLKIGDQWVDYQNLWQNYVAQNLPGCHIAICSFDQNPLHGHFDCFQLPERATAFFDGVSKEIGTNEKYNGFTIDIEFKLQRFFAGHGKESLMEVLYKLMRKLHLIEKEVNDGDWTFPKIISEYLDSEYTFRNWQDFRIKWDRYYQFFEYLPYRQLIVDIDQEIKYISPFFDGKCKSEDLFLHLECWKRLQTICTTLANIRKESGLLLKNNSLIIQ